MNFIKRAFDDKVDERTHLQFQKFSKGEFKGRALIKAKSSGGKYNISTTAEFANELVSEVAKRLGNNKTLVKGVVVSTADLTGKLNFKDKKQFMGIKQYVIEGEMTGKEILDLIDKLPAAFFGLSFIDSSTGTELKIKPKAPKSAKPSTKSEEKPNPKFCKLTTTDKELAKSFVFEVPDFKLAEITHSFLINDIIVPNELKNEKDFAKIREMARRKGKIIRRAEIDGKKFLNEKDFEA